MYCLTALALLDEPEFVSFLNDELSGVILFLHKLLDVIRCELIHPFWRGLLSCHCVQELISYGCLVGQEYLSHFPIGNEIGSNKVSNLAL